jgi:hypothetical protein
MRQSKFTETQIVSILKEADAGCTVNEIWWQYASAATYAGINVAGSSNASLPGSSGNDVSGALGILRRELLWVCAARLHHHAPQTILR